ncbi:MAG: threonylcarbamoyl-AMP synthase [Candidatus Sericytochromatia bacterium]|nr:threonylcarbamoyl-AMP synthase [Candidatus Sericytochromatia bacterium]
MSESTSQQAADAFNTRIEALSPQALQEAVDLLRTGEVVAMPTETVYGLAGHAFDAAAVARIFAVKARPHFDPLIVHLADQPQHHSLQGLAAAELIVLQDLPANIQAACERLIKAFWPGPLTLVLPRHARVPDLVTGDLPTVALRMPAHAGAQALLQQSFPLAAPSANRFGRISPTTAQAVYEELRGRISLILDGGPCAIGLESTVVGLEDEQLVLLRPGLLDLDTLQQAAQSPLRPATQHPAELRAPGMLKSHYAPGKPLQVFESGQTVPLQSTAAGRPGLLCLQTPPAEVQAQLAARGGQWRALSPDGSLHLAAQALFAHLRALDSAAVDYLLAELPASDQGLGYAIRDRLHKAAAPVIQNEPFFALPE